MNTIALNHPLSFFLFVHPIDAEAGARALLAHPAHGQASARKRAGARAWSPLARDVAGERRRARLGRHRPDLELSEQRASVGSLECSWKPLRLTFYMYRAVREA